MLASFLLGFLPFLQRLLPPNFIFFLLDYLTPYTYFEIPEFNGVNVNVLYHQVALYLSSIPAVNCHRLTLSRSAYFYSVAPDHIVRDCYDGHLLSWSHRIDDEKRTFVLKLPNRRRPVLLEPYLHHVTARAAELERESREQRLFTNDGFGWWSSVEFRHPSTFDTLAIEPDLKSWLSEDLTAFAKGKELYRRTGRAWKRGYLVYGPPGSGKSSLIAAMANFLRYDVYDLELDKIDDNSEIRALLMRTTNRSIIVIEDINEEEVVSGLRSFISGLWSCCGEERIMILTTNQYDPVLRMDVHVSLGTCGVHALKVMVRNYLDLESHVLFNAAESYLRDGGALTPGEVGEILLRNRRDADVAVKAVVSAMQAKISADRQPELSVIR